MAFLLVAALLCGAAPLIKSHATCTVDEVTTSDKYFDTAVRIGHACNYNGGDSTTKVKITFPSYSDWAITSVRGGMLANWNYSTVSRNISSLGYSSHGTAIESTVSSIIFTATGDLLSDTQFQDFPVKFKLAKPDGSFPLSVGEVLYLPTVQYCLNGTYRDWANESDTEGGHQPSVTVVDDSTDDDDDDAQDDDDDEKIKKALKQKANTAILVASSALVLCGLLVLSLIWLTLAIQDLRNQVRSPVSAPSEAKTKGAKDGLAV